ncbi:response regulators consisting of a CheY-like receiver domain and a winged-helix DNA-binding domain [Anaerolinea thermolimosa]|uniref:response regulator n=1 Tax=Anaerolinea thermolimosa TaxID=229919 RepID=UPI000782B96E|nr:response regulator [Anaerolinea thermolimosa]GAP06807.1 response regulators consisting of a CheY-like receiver domain and a winged-helix DNA-binding domain [Anaerolinea thermolimosa]
MSDERPRVLVVDEDPLALELYRRELETDYAVTATPSVEETRRFLQEVSFDVVILEPASNEDEGWTLLREIFALVAPPAVILCSVEDERKVGLSQGAQVFLVKPVLPVMLHTTVQQVLAVRSNLSNRRAEPNP